VSEEARRYGPHFVEPFALPIDLGERKNSFSVPRGAPQPLSDTRTPLADFFSILLSIHLFSQGWPYNE
jgi:hypothetical protein